MPNIESLRGASNAAATKGLCGAGLDVAGATPTVRVGGSGRPTTGSRPPPVGAVCSVGCWLLLAAVRMAAARPAAPAGVVTTVGATAAGAAEELVGSLFADVLDVAAGVTDPDGTRGRVGTLELVGGSDSVGLPPPGEWPPGVEPTGGRGDETVADEVTDDVTDDVTDGGTGGLLWCGPWPSCLRW